ncbi:hypothetical protein F4820DRAFT_444355 [Hypoxylon rubiginosum]|uniref:Uncharacterized protein n=1 Tax=Hypoxylon rubiginosum TaxID=110542 RepID=A0ACB9ZE17_9PEZI|nr:hypothetical protein F4820DRAFT_444355 [Hypoxylon rubiginosum]
MSPGGAGALPGDKTYVVPTNLPPGVSADNQHGLPTDPPPGLVRVMPPVPADEHEVYKQVTTRVFTEGDIVMFGEMANYLSGFDIEGNRIVLDLTCQICGDLKLDVSPRTAPEQSAQDRQESEPFTVLPCGHFFGDYCLREWFCTREDNELPRDCPYCRYVLVHERCGHNMKLRQFDPRFPRDGQTPLTLPEGGVVSLDCDTCAKEALEYLASKLVLRVFPEVRDAAFTDPDECNSATFEALRNRMWQDIFKCYGWGEQQFNFW